MRWGNSIAEKEVGLLALGDKLARGVAIEKFHQRRDALLNRNGGHVGGRLDAEDRDLFFDKILKQIAVIAGNFHDQTLPIDGETVDHVVGISLGMREPTVGIRGEVEVVAENVFWSDELLKLDQEAFSADIDVKRVRRLHLA